MEIDRLAEVQVKYYYRVMQPYFLAAVPKSSYLSLLISKYDELVRDPLNLEKYLELTGEKITESIN